MPRLVSVFSPLLSVSLYSESCTRAPLMFLSPMLRTGRSRGGMQDERRARHILRGQAQRLQARLYECEQERSHFKALASRYPLNFYLLPASPMLCVCFALYLSRDYWRSRHAYR